MTDRKYIAPLCQVFAFSIRSGVLSASVGGSSQPFGPFIGGDEIGGMSGEDYSAQDNSGFGFK